MNLVEWLDVKGNTAAELCRKSGLRPPAISKIVHGKITTTLRTALLLDRGTGGEIKAEKVCPAEAELISYLRSAA